MINDITRMHFNVHFLTCLMDTIFCDLMQNYFRTMKGELGETWTQLPQCILHCFAENYRFQRNLLGFKFQMVRAYD